MRIDMPICCHKECKRICKYYLIDGNCRLNTNVKPCEDVIEEIMDMWIYEQEGSMEDD